MIEKVIEAIKNRGWLQGNYSDADGYVCILGAVNLVVFDDANHWIDDTEVLEPIISEVIREQFPDRVANLINQGLVRDGMSVVPAFNDHDDTTLSDVMLVLEKARVKEQECADFSEG